MHTEQRDVVGMTLAMLGLTGPSLATQPVEVLEALERVMKVWHTAWRCAPCCDTCACVRACVWHRSWTCFDAWHHALMSRYAGMACGRVCGSWRVSERTCRF